MSYTETKYPSGAVVRVLDNDEPEPLTEDQRVLLEIAANVEYLTLLKEMEVEL